MIRYTCRWFAFEIGYSYKYDTTGVWLFGPHHNQRSRTGTLRSECQFVLWWYDQNRNRLWLNPWDVSSLPVAGNRDAGWRRAMRRFRFARWKMDPRLEHFPVRPTEYHQLRIARQSMSATLIAMLVIAAFIGGVVLAMVLTYIAVCAAIARALGW
jgi:hypothetical protein